MTQSVTRALGILGQLGDGERSLDELAPVIGVHKSTVLRLLRTLEAEGFAEHDAAHRYRLGPRLFELSNRALAGREVRAVARPHLERLNARSRQTVHLAEYISGEVVYTDKLDATHGVRMYSRVGLRAPLHCTAVAKVLLAGLPDPVAEDILTRIDYEAFTPRTIGSAERLREELARVRDDGYAVDHEEHEAFITCVAAPVRDGTGTAVAAVSVSVPTVVLDHEQVLELRPLVVETATAISADLGRAASTTGGQTAPEAANTGRG